LTDEALGRLVSFLNVETYSQIPNRRRYPPDNDPPYLLIARSGCREEAQMFMGKTYQSLLYVFKNPQKGIFHSESGILGRALVMYLREISSVYHVFQFTRRLYDYMAGKRKTVPRNVSDFGEYYTALKKLLKSRYTRRLIERNTLGEQIRTQDFALFYRLKFEIFAETFLCTATDTEIVDLIETVR
jgi:hypothetical protein